ncbi:hypothetical protein GNP79_19470 [Aliivibrio fischeri]|uniref:hypothetical protein n=1 Tax=Aliivibrio fischeri TaxID=668 RepID=UPI0012D9B708|nr:hypothetical protein [Aliivibrio fischeri]MUK79107.1 hypothetical protein [Aliivibrio fischeri]MUK82959.1 hypothetical protein [Aliivibrio fischeri]
MDQILLNKYLSYANTDEAFAVLFVKKNLKQTKSYWVDIVDCDRYEMSSNNLHFRFVVGYLYKRKLQPKYPPKSEYTKNGIFDERRYLLMVRAITWEVAHKDIQQQKQNRSPSRKFHITGVSYDKNRGNTHFFRSDAPPKIKALANNLNIRTDPLWDIALKYANKPEFVYKIKKVFLANESA